MRDARQMTQDERRLWLIERLLSERAEYADVRVPQGEAEQRELLRALMNVRPPEPVDEEFLLVQDAYLVARVAERGVTHVSDLLPVGNEGDEGTAVSVAWRHHHARCRRHRQRGKRSDAGLLCPRPPLH